MDVRRPCGIGLERGDDDLVQPVVLYAVVSGACLRICYHAVRIGGAVVSGDENCCWGGEFRCLVLVNG